MVNLNQHGYKPEDVTEYDLIPDGSVQSIMVQEAEITQSKAGHNMLKLTYEVAEGDFKGFKMMDFLMLEHESEKTVNICKKN